MSRARRRGNPGAAIGVAMVAGIWTALLAYGLTVHHTGVLIGCTVTALVAALCWMARR